MQILAHMLIGFVYKISRAHASRPASRHKDWLSQVEK
jgi:hypothetical protein